MAANIDTLSIQFKANGTDKAVKNIKEMAKAVKTLGDSVNNLSAAKLKSFTSAMDTLKSSTPTKGQAQRMKDFASGVRSLSNAIGNANINGFAKSMANIGTAVSGLKGQSLKGITNTLNAMQQLGQQAQQTGNQVKNALGNLPTNNQPVAPQVQTPISPQALQAAIPMLDKLKISMTDIGEKLSRMKIIVPTKQMQALEKEAEKVRKKYDELRESMIQAMQNGNMTQGDDNYKKKMAQLDALRQQYDELILKQKELALEGGGIQLNPQIKGALQSFQTGFTKASNVIRSGFTMAIRSANSHLKKFASHLFQADKAANLLKKADLTSSLRKVGNELLRVSKMLKLMVTRMALRAVIKEVGNGFKSLAIHSDEFNNAISNVINGSKQLGYSFAAMISPLINALAPAIVYIINLLTKLLNVINQVFSALTGKGTWNKAKKFTDSWRDSITGAGSAAGKAAKEIKKTVLGFDELNQLQDNKDSGGGGGSDIKDMFETVPIDDKWKDFAKWLKDMWENKDFYDLGKKIGEKLRDVLESIPWDKIRQTSNDLGKCLATLINGFVEVERLGYDIGYTVAQSVNTVFEFINGFVHELHWDSIGKFIAETFNGFFENIDWELIKDTVVTGMAGIAEAIQSFIDNFHWDNISQFIINAVDTIVSGIKAFIEGIDWKDLGQKIGDQITKTIKGINWTEIGQALGEILQAAIDLFAGLIDKINVDDVVKAVTEMINGFFDKVDMEEAGKNIGKVLHKIIEFIKKFWDENGDTIKTEFGKFFRGIFEELDIGDIASILMVTVGIPVLSGLVSVAGWVVKELAAKAISQLITKALFGGAATTVAAEGATVGASATAAVATGASSSSMLGSVTVAGSTIGSTLTGAIAAAIAFFGGAEIGKISWKWLYPDELDDLKEKYGGLGGTINLFKDTADAAWYEIKEAAKTFGERTVEHWDNFKEGVSNDAETVQEATRVFAERTSEHWSDFKDNVKKSTDDVKEATRVFGERSAEHLSDFKEKASEHLETTKEAFKTFSERSQEHFDDFKTKASSTMDNIKQDLGTFKEDWATKWQDAKAKLDDFKTNSATTLTDIKDNVVKCFEGIKNGIKTPINGALDFVEKLVNGIIDAFNGLGDKLGSLDIDLPDWVEEKTGISDFTIGLPKLNRITIPRLANGGQLKEDGFFFANHNELVGSFDNGRTAVTNNEQILKSIENGVYNAVMSAMANSNSGASYISNEIVVDGDVIARTITKAQEKQQRRYSPQTV